MTILENVQLRQHTTFKVGGPARFFAAVASEADLLEALAFVRERSVPFFVMGGGSNLLVSDAGFPGLVIKVDIGGVSVAADVVTAGAGVVWDDLVAYAVSQGLYGLENLSLIPGTVGAAPVQNIGAYGREAKDSVLWVEAIHAHTGEKRRFTNAECLFGYRDSFFKSREGKPYVVTRVAWKLSRDGMLDGRYKDVREYVDAHGIKDLTLQCLRDVIIAIRTAKLPDLARFGTAGSFWKNPIVPEADYLRLLARYPDLPRYPALPDGRMKVSAAWLIDKVCGMRGYRWGAVGAYEKQALVLVNYGGATSDELKALADRMAATVKERSGVELEREVEYVP